MTKRGFVYLIRAGEDGPVKIGWALDPAARLRELQCGNHAALQIVRSVPGSIADEKHAHRRFSAQRVRGEWFAFRDEMLSWEPCAEPITSMITKRSGALAAYLLANRITQAMLAARVGVSREYLSMLMTNAKRRPSLGVAVRIERETNGAVPARAWAAPESVQAGT